jgi:hypothetical protein
VTNVTPTVIGGNVTSVTPLPIHGTHVTTVTHSPTHRDVTNVTLGNVTNVTLGNVTNDTFHVEHAIDSEGGSHVIVRVSGQPHRQTRSITWHTSSE